MKSKGALAIFNICINQLSCCAMFCSMYMYHLSIYVLDPRKLEVIPAIFICVYKTKVERLCNGNLNNMKFKNKKMEMQVE